jgi:hypothetical protein
MEVPTLFLHVSSFWSLKPKLCSDNLIDRIKLLLSVACTMLWYLPGQSMGETLAENRERVVRHFHNVYVMMPVCAANRREISGDMLFRPEFLKTENVSILAQLFGR